jgi:hypothetical protein
MEDSNDVPALNSINCESPPLAIRSGLHAVRLMFSCGTVNTAFLDPLPACRWRARGAVSCRPAVCQLPNDCSPAKT